MIITTYTEKIKQWSTVCGTTKQEIHLKIAQLAKSYIFSENSWNQGGSKTMFPRAIINIKIKFVAFNLT